MDNEAYWWMEVDLKNAELPLCVADNASELAKLRGIKVRKIHSERYHAKQKGYKCKYVKIRRSDGKEV